MTDEPKFAHASEAELARILNYYGVRWEYEPRTFPILWGLDGKVVESFSPDFYLPDLNTYVELTTLKQSLVRRKNRKLRRLRELYPDIRVKLFYGKDFRALMLKYGRFDLAASLSGLEGQLSPIARPSEPALPVPPARPSWRPQSTKMPWLRHPHLRRPWRQAAAGGASRVARAGAAAGARSWPRGPHRRR